MYLQLNFVADDCPFQKVILSLCLILPLLWPAKKTETYYIWLPVHVLETHLINFLLKSQPNTPPSPIYLVPDTTSKLPSFCFLWEEVRKKCTDRLFFHQTRFIACLQWKALWFNTSVLSKDLSKIPYFPDFIMRSRCLIPYTFCEDCYIPSLNAQSDSLSVSGILETFTYWHAHRNYF